MEWLLLGASGVALSLQLNPALMAPTVALWIMGIVHNVPPISAKAWPYVDALSESLNNPIRLLLSCFAIVSSRVPPMSPLLSHWMVGAFLAAKRLAEYRHLGTATRSRPTTSLARATVSKAFVYLFKEVMVVLSVPGPTIQRRARASPGKYSRSAEWHP
jgi:hypothetical protein